METGEECPAVEGRGCLAAATPPAPRCANGAGEGVDTGLEGAIEGSGCSCGMAAAPDAWIGLVLMGVVACRRFWRH
ncbi:MAG: hypothetical protein H6737_25335 [Alphaproteobacteria bacterium]|nr:hypothetical protein [Alphaproteobacteria bacterium]